MLVCFAALGAGGWLYWQQEQAKKAAKTGKVGDGKIATGDLRAVVDPRLEWRQMFEDAWRLERDFYYDPAMGGLDWKAVGEPSILFAPLEMKDA